MGGLNKKNEQKDRYRERERETERDRIERERERVKEWEGKNEIKKMKRAKDRKKENYFVGCNERVGYEVLVRICESKLI